MSDKSLKIIDILKSNGSGVAFEFFPPKTATRKDSLGRTIEVLKKYKPLYTSMTYGAAGTTQSATKEAVALLLENKDLVVMPHLTCIGARRDSINALLAEYKQKGVKNIMALRGDLPRDCEDLNLEFKDFRYAKDLVKAIKQNNHFSIAVAVYPEGHIETSSLAEDTEYTKQKVDSGADFSVTQMFFDNQYFYSFLERAKKGGINLPILPGILPLTSLKKVKQFSQLCRTTIPKAIEKRMLKFEDNLEDQEKCGLEFTINQCRDLKKNGFKRLHFFALNKSKPIETILEAL